MYILILEIIKVECLPYVQQSIAFLKSLLFWEITKPEFLYCILVMTFLSMFSVYSKSTRIHFIPLFNYLYWGIVNCTSSNKSEHLGGQIDCVILNQPLLKLIAIDYHIVLCSILSPSLWGDFNSDTISNLGVFEEKQGHGVSSVIFNFSSIFSMYDFFSKHCSINKRNTKRYLKKSKDMVSHLQLF
jgi:hypothetical protein